MIEQCSRHPALQRCPRLGLLAIVALLAAAALALPAVASAQQLDVADDSVFEDPGAEIRFDITRGAPTTGTTTAQYTVSPGTAMLGSDYTGPIVDDDGTPGDGVATFGPGVTTVRVTVPLVNDHLPESDENLFLDLGTIVGGTAGDDHGVGVIHDNDPNSPYWTAVRNDNPARYFRMDDPGPPTMFDETFGADGTHVSDPTFGVGGALMSETPNLSVGYSDADPDRSTFGVAAHDAFTIEFWVLSLEPNPDADDDLWYEGKGLVDGDISGAANDSGVALVRNGHVGFGLGNPDTMIESTTAVNDGGWHHIAATSDGNGNMRLYVDGALQDQENAGPAANRANTSFTIGALNFPIGTTGEMLGFLDEVAFYPHALTQTDVSEHFNAAQGAQSRVRVDFSVVGGGYVAGPGISCAQGGVAGCFSNQPLGAILDYTAFPDAGYRLGRFSFLGDCTPFSANQCRVTADKAVENSLITFHPKPDVSAEQMRKGLDAAADAILKGIGAAVSGGKGPSKPPAQIVMPPVIPPGSGGVGGLLTSIVKRPIAGAPNLGVPPPAKIVEDAKNKLVGSDGGSLLSDAGGGLISDKGGGLISDAGSGVQASASRAVAAAVSAKKKKKKPKAKTVVLGSYVTRTDGSSIQPVLQLTAAGRKLLARIGALNKRRKRKIVPKTSFLQVFQPADNGSWGGAVINLKLK